MGVTPQHAPNIRVSIEHSKEICGVIQTDVIEPCAAHGDRRVMQHHERMALQLRHRDGLEPAAIAARMNLPESIVSDLLRRAERTIRAAQLAFLEALSEHAPRAVSR